MEVEVEFEEETDFVKGTPIHYNNENVSHDSKTCQVCLLPSNSSSFVTFDKCGHDFCSTCVNTVYDSHVKDGKVSLTCLECSNEATPIIIRDTLSPEQYHRYLDFTLRQYLALEPNVRQCIAPDCPFAYIIDNPSNCEDEHFVCKRDGCNSEYCVKCKGAWHEGLTCKKARKKRKNDKNGPIADVLGKDILKTINIKLCPRCGTAIEKIEDGGCNHVVCHICKLEFCWLCLRPGTELHYLSPTGCPMYGQQRWAWWKTWGLRICLWLGAPIITLFLVFIVFFLSLFLLPILITYLIYSALKELFVNKKCMLIILCVIVTIVGYFVSPLLSLLLAFIVIPLTFFYFYCFIPMHIIATNMPQRIERTNVNQV